MSGADGKPEPLPQEENKGKMPALKGCKAGQGEEAARPQKKVDPRTKSAAGEGKSSEM